MFFTPELLQRRDSGFGLLWLAATLGSKSSLRKLPRKGILHADIPQLCGMITDPEEPLALRLSANLMVGVIRVYHARHELWANDVTHTFTMLKKAVATMYSIDAPARGLEMAQGTVKADAITLGNDALHVEGGGLDFDFMVDLGMADFPIPRGPTPLPDSSFAPTPTSAHAANSRAPRTNTLANPRSITLDESHLLPLQHSDPYEFHFDGVGVGAGTSSEGNELFGGMEFAGAGAGEGWGGAGGVDDGRIDLGLGLEEDGWGLQAGGEVVGGADEWGMGAGAGDVVDFHLDSGAAGPSSPSTHLSSAVRRAMQPVQHRRALGLPDSSPRTPPLTHSRTPSDEDRTAAAGLRSALKRPAAGEEAGELEEAVQEKKRAKKRVKLLLDQRTELTDAELMASRENYVETMLSARQSELARRPQNWVSTMLGPQSVPEEYEAKELRDFWTSIMTARLEARKRRWSSSSDSPESDEDENGKRAKQRRLTQPPSSEDRVGQGRGRIVYPDDELLPGDMGMMGQQDWGDNLGWGDQQMENQEPDFNLPEAANFTVGTPRLSQLRSGTPLSVEQGRAASSLSNAHSASFPWDNLPGGGPSSSSWAPFRSEGSADRRSGSRSRLGSPAVEGVEMADARIRQSNSRRESSVGLSELGSTPRKLVEGSQGPVETFEGFQEATTQNQSQPEGESLATLERNALNFLEYIKMQRNAAIPGGGGASLLFTQIVPAYAKTRHVAANAFYNCLVLATKGLLGVQQNAPYEEIYVRPL